MFILFKKEFKAYFNNVIAYIFLSTFLFFTGIYFVVTNLFNMNSSFNYVLNDLVLIILFMVPVFTMRLLSEERRNKTDQLLYTSPQSISGIVLGKYAAAFTLFLLGTCITIIYPIIFGRFGKLALSEIISSYIGFILIGGTFISIGMLISAIAESQVTAAIGTLGALLGLWFIEPITNSLPKDEVSGLIFVIILVIAFAAIIYVATKNIVIPIIVGLIGTAASVITFFINKAVFSGIITKFFQWFAIIDKSYSFSEGLIPLASIVYYISFIFIMLLFTVRLIEKRRWS